MARNDKQGIENNFIKGLITETTAIKFPKDACTETYNCIFDEVGRVTRRKGLDLETSATFSDLSYDEDAAFSEFIWNAVRGEGERSFLCVQRGNLVEFYDISSSVTTVSGNKKSFSVDLNLFIPGGSSLTPANKPCKFAQGNGNLVIVNSACNPILVVYDDTADTIASSTITLKQRDFAGVDDGLGVDSRPTETVAGIKLSNPEHYYNMLNQGWHYDAGTALSAWDTALTTLPSNADTVGYYLGSTGALDTTLLANKTPGNTGAPKGHFILDIFAPNRTDAMVTDGFTGASVGSGQLLYNTSGDTAMTSLTGAVLMTNHANILDGNTGTVGTINNNTRVFTGRQLASPQAFTSFVFKNSSTVGTNSMTIYVRGKQGSAPTSYSDGTNLGNVTLQPNVVTPIATAVCTDTTTEWDYVWFEYNNTLNGGNVTVGELEFYENDPNSEEEPITYTRPSSTAFFAGRAWYAGVNGLDLNNTIFFSQIIQDNSQYGKCYQNNDPTSEDFPDLLQDDGGYVKIPGMATVTHIGNFHNALLVFATNGVWAVSGSNKQYFTATAYGVRKISGVGTSAGTSFADVKGVPYWWGESGIYTVNYDPNYDAYGVVSLSDSSIYSFFNDIPALNRKYVKASYDIDTETITWLYNNATSLTTADKYKFDRALVFNTMSKAFYPWTISTSASVPNVRGIVHVRAALDASSSVTKFVVTDPDDLVTSSYTFAEVKDTTYTDWPTYGDGINYDSYFITGYTIDGGLMRQTTPGYVMVYMEEEANSSAFLRAIYDWTTSSSEGQTTNSQQLYNTSLSNRTVKARKLKMRGRGLSMQMKVYSEATKPFSIVGWAFTISTENRI